MNAVRSTLLSSPGKITIAMLGWLFAAGFLALWILQGATSKPAMGFMQAPSEMKKYTAEQVKARFPKEKHVEFMRRAIANSRKAAIEFKTGGAFGAVVVDKDGRVLSDGLNHVVAQNDPTWHAEMHAIRQACALLKKPKLDGCIIYTSAEPCPMCLATMYWAGVDGCFYGAIADDSKKYGNFDDNYIYDEVRKEQGHRLLAEVPFLRSEAVEVWKEYQARKDKVDY